MDTQANQTVVVEHKPSTAAVAVKVVGETFLPGASLLIDGQLAKGGLHVLAGALVRSLLGPAGVVLVIANSLSTSLAGKNLVQQIKK